jgi:hypothetical protein
MKAERSIDLSPIAHKLEGAAFELFRMWTKYVPREKDIEIIDERLLVEDVRQAFENALRALAKDDSAMAETEDYGMWYVISFVQANLNTRWNHQYVTRNTEIYRQFVTLRAIENYLDFDKLAEIRIEKIYEAILSQDTNLANVETKTTRLRYDFETKGGIKLVPTEESGTIRTILSNLTATLTLQISKADCDVYLPIRHVFGEETLKELVRENRIVES